MTAKTGELFEFGPVIGTHGLRGDLKVKALSGDVSILEGVEQVFLAREGQEPVPYVLTRATFHKGKVLLKLQGVDGIELAKTLVGCRLSLRYDDLSELPEEEHYWFELEGLTVCDQTRGELGRLEEMFSTPAHDIYVVRGPYGEVLIPVVEQFVLKIDLAGQCILVDLPDGLVPDPHDL